MERRVGDYAIESRIAVGGMAEIYRGSTVSGPDAGRPVVLKRLLPNHRADPRFVERFVDEAKLAVRLRHPNIVRTDKLFRKERDYYMVQELVDGPTLETLLAHARRAKKPLSAGAAVWACQETLRALDYLHRATLSGTTVHVVHRDVNPSNLLVARDGAVKLTDFGLAEAEGISRRAEKGVLAGTIAYMAPEQVLGRPLDARADLWAVGVMLWEMLANRHLFAAGTDFATMEKIREGRVPPILAVVPAGLSAVVAKALQLDPEKRFHGAKAFLTDLGESARTLGPRADLLAAEVAGRVL